MKHKWESRLPGEIRTSLPAMQETWVRPLGQEDPLEKEMATHSSILFFFFLLPPPTPVFLPGEFHRQRSLVGYSPWMAKSRTRLSDFTSDMQMTPPLWQKVKKN